MTSTRLSSNGIDVPKDFNHCLYEPLEEADPEIASLIKKETYRQFRGLELIASENLTSLAVMQANGSFLTNKYSEGLPGNRYYGGNEYIDEIERLCQKRALECFHLNPEEWAVNVQPYSGSTANFAAFTALVPPHSRIMGLALPDGGHLTHGAFTPKRRISASSIYFESMPYQVDPSTGLIDYELLKKNANLFKPKIIICGASAYPRDWDYKKLREIADEQEAYLMMDMAHISGLIAAQVQNSPFEYCDLVSTTTHKTLRGPRAGLIFSNKKRVPDLAKRVDDAVFPACQGGPHNNTIAAVAVALKQASTPEFKEYALQVIKNSQALGEALVSYKYKIQTNGTDNHLLLWDLRPLGLTGSKIEKVCDLVHITLNKNSVPGDKSAQTPGGIRVGTNALTSRSMKEEEMKVVGEFLKEAVDIALVLQKEAGSKLLKDFLKVATSGESEGRKRLKELEEKVKEFATKWPLPGVRDSDSITP